MVPRRVILHTVSAVSSLDVAGVLYSMARIVTLRTIRTMPRLGTAVLFHVMSRVVHIPEFVD